VKANKQKSYDDFIAVAEDLIASGVTRPATWASRAAATAACWWAR
jgi:prolyl oligopeptidase PreP (S9A serine peptidase family)